MKTETLTGKELHDRATALLRSKGYQFQDHGCWQYTEDHGMFMLGWSNDCMNVATTCNMGEEITAPIEMRSMAEFETLVRLIETFTEGRVLPRHEYADKIEHSWQEFVSR